MNNSLFLEKGEGYFRKLLIYTPNRLDFIYGLAVNLFYQKKYDESFASFEKSFDLSPSYFLRQKKEVEGTYVVFIQYFYTLKDKENFIKATARLKMNGYEGSVVLEQIIEFINKNNTWPVVNFK